MNGLIAGAFAIDMIAQGILQGRQAVDQIGKNKDELAAEMQKAYKETENIVAMPEHDAVKKSYEKSLDHSSSPSPTDADLRSIS